LSEGLAEDGLELSVPIHKSIEIAAEDGTLARLSIEVTPYLRRDMSEVRKQGYLDQCFGSVIASNLYGLVKGVDFFIISGVAAEKNQLGYHSQYSSV
jgi:hypothetical protein